MSDISSIKLPDNSSYNIKAKKIFYAECSTARNVAAKVVTCDGFALETGAVIAVQFTNKGNANPSSGNITLNINETGAKNIVPKDHISIYTYGSGGYFYNNQTHLFVYNGTYFIHMNRDINTDTKVTSVRNHYTPAKSTTKSASGGTVTDITNLTSGTQVVTGVEMDAKGHVTGVTSVALKSTDTQVTVDSALSSTSTNPVQNKVINSALAGKAAASHSHTISQISDFPASLPANGGNANTVGGKNASDFVEALTNAQITNAKVLIPNNVDVVNWLLTNAKIGGLYYRTANSTGQTNLPNLTNTSWAWFTYDGNRYLARVMIDNYSTRDFLLNMVNKVGGWKEISTTPIKSTTFSANVNNIGNFTLWSLSEKKVPISIQLDNTTFYAVPFLYINHLWMGSTIHEATRQPVINTAVSGTIYYIDI